MKKIATLLFLTLLLLWTKVYLRKEISETKTHHTIQDEESETGSHHSIFDDNVGTTIYHALPDNTIGTTTNNPIFDGKIGTESNRLIVDGNIGREASHSPSDDENKTDISYNNPFEPEVLEDFPTLETENPRIPHIIHFIFITGVAGKGGIPAKYVENVNSFAVLNPDWAIYFWSDISARMLISTKYPSFLSTWDKYRLVIHKADALLYIVLYEFGGVYSDLDVLCVRPLDRATMKYPCIISPEPFEHSTIFTRKPLLLNAAFVLCREKHPLMKQAISHLPRSVHNRFIIEVAGPKFLTRQYMIYNNLTWDDLLRNKTDLDSNSPYFYKGSRAVDDNDAIYIPNTRYFMNTMMKNEFYKKECRKFSSSNTLVKRGCESWKERTKNLSLHKFSYVDHQWFHAYSFPNSTKLIPIDSIVSKKQLKIWGLWESVTNDSFEH